MNQLSINLFEIHTKLGLNLTKMAKDPIISLELLNKLLDAHEKFVLEEANLIYILNYGERNEKT